MMSKRRAYPKNYQDQIAAQHFERGVNMILPGLMGAILVFLLIVNWIGNPSQPVYAAADQTLPSSVEDDILGQECTIGIRYPESIRQWCGFINEAAGKYNLEPDLLAAVMLQESGGNPDAYSKSGAVGLMQVMPRDGIAANFMCKNGPCFAARPTMEELFTPAFNVDYGARMLAGLIQRTGSIREALLAYGPMDVGYYYADLVLSILQNYR